MSSGADTATKQSKDEVLASLELPEDPQAHLQELAAKLEAAQRVVAEHSDADEQAPATMETQGRLRLDKLAPQESPDDLTELARRCQAMLPRVDLPDLIMSRATHRWSLQTNGRRAPDRQPRDAVAGEHSFGGLKNRRAMDVVAGLRDCASRDGLQTRQR